MNRPRVVENDIVNFEAIESSAHIRTSSSFFEGKEVSAFFSVGSATVILEHTRMREVLQLVEAQR